ncbi:MAG: glycosyltransferase [Deltaproteobacteria bacterium]
MRRSVLVVTNLYPSEARPDFAPFNRQQFRALAEIADVEIFALVPRKIFPPLRSGLSRHEVFDGIDVFRPRFLTVPGAVALNAASVASSVTAHLAARRLRGQRYDLVLGAYAYPDACGALVAAKAQGLPVVVKCHGSDLNRVPEHLSARLQMEQLLPRAERVVCVSEKLAEAAQLLNVPRERIDVVYNGIDRERFHVRDRDAARRTLGLTDVDRLILYVGHLADHKGAEDLLRAAELLSRTTPNATVLYVGDGPMLDTLQANPTVRAVGRKPHEQIATYLAACDVLTLPSWDEGMPNVVREAHACGRPVVATHVGGIPEAVHHPALGRLVPPSNPEALADALAAQLAEPVEPERITQLAQVPTWEESAASLLVTLERAITSA